LYTIHVHPQIDVQCSNKLQKLQQKKKIEKIFSEKPEINLKIPLKKINFAHKNDEK
jgi:hypothetical protein